MKSKPMNLNRRGFSLIETVVSLVIVSVLMLGLSSSVMLGSFALPSVGELGESDREVQSVLAMMRDDFRRASGVQYTTAAGGTQFRLTLKTTGTTGEASTVIWEYSTANDEISYTFGTNTKKVVLEKVSAFTATLNKDGADLRVLKLLIVVDGTIQENFECHFLLPDKPEVT